MAYPHQIIEPQGAVHWVTLNRPEQVNTMPPQLLQRRTTTSPRWSATMRSVWSCCAVPVAPSVPGWT